MKMFFAKWSLLLVFAVCAGALAFLYWGGVSLTLHAKATELGQLGDFFGGLLNPLVSALTLFVAINVWRLQNDELELTRNELAQTKAVMEEQAKTAEQQRAEARFFDLLNIYQLTLGSLSKTIPMGGVNGAAVVLSGRAALPSLFRREICNFFDSGSQTTENDLALAGHLWIKESKQIGHYFRTVLMVLKQAQETLGEAHHFRYVKMFRAQLSREELVLLALNMLFDEEGEKMREVACKYGILKHLPRNHLSKRVEKDIDPLIFGRGCVRKRDPLKI